MDPKSKENFDRIVRMEPEALTPGDIEFLKVRQSYLTASDRERYGKLLGTAEEAPAAPSQPASRSKK